jgi:DNA repair protein RadA/Sms
MQELSRVDTRATPRIILPTNEFNRVLGGGIVPGSLILVSGDPGIGKSTLLLQASAMVADGGEKVIYASGEESLEQVKLRADRLGLGGERLYLISETNLDAILGWVEEISPALVIIDSIQAVYLDEMESLPGSVGQVRECTARLMRWAKLSGIPLFITGHVTKEGAIAGPRVLEHMVDVVLYLEGENFSAYRVLRGVKNRFGSTNEVGVFEMGNEGLVQVDNPSRLFISQRSGETIGSAIVSTIEGSRPLLVEIQALTANTSFGLPRRTANGVDFSRLLIVVAVLTKRVGLSLSNQDIIVNVVGGLKVGEPAADLGIALAVASSFREVEIDPRLVAVGEVGLSGEVRAVPQLERRLSEASRLGFERCLVPKASVGTITAPGDVDLIGVDSLKQALKVALSKPRRLGTNG